MRRIAGTAAARADRRTTSGPRRADAPGALTSEIGEGCEPAEGRVHHVEDHDLRQALAGGQAANDFRVRCGLADVEAADFEDGAQQLTNRRLGAGDQRATPAHGGPAGPATARFSHHGSGQLRPAPYAWLYNTFHLCARPARAETAPITPDQSVRRVVQQGICQAA